MYKFNRNKLLFYDLWNPLSSKYMCRKMIAICASHLLNRAPNLLIREYNLLTCTKYLARNLLTRFINRLLHCAHNLRKLLRSSCSIARTNDVS